MSLTVPLYGFGGGGESLNFKVVGDTTEPTNPNENTIWVNTDKKIASWIFSATQPKTATEGMVWIFTSTFSAAEFNALKKNGIQVYPISAKQYVGGAWVDKTAKSYQNGEWTDMHMFLYKNGNEYKELTGGWSVFQYGPHESDTSECSNDGGKLTLQLIGTRSSIAYGTEEPIDLTAYTAIEFTVDELNIQMGFGVSTMRNTTTYDNPSVQIVRTEPGVYLLPVNNLKGSYYVWFGNYTNGGTNYGAVVSKIRLVI
jgi:hypothetical protein